MDQLRVGIIGCGRPWKSEGATGFGMSREHAKGYLKAGCHIAALADLNRENAEAFQKDLGGDAIYTDYHQMLAEAKLDIVSISTWPKLHTEMVLAAARAGVKAIHCEKPMAMTFGESREMVQVCDELKVQLTFNHQRRFGTPFIWMRQAVRDGRIGELKRMELSCGNLYDWGTHWFDMMFYYNAETPAEWVIGQIDTRGTKDVFGAPCEGQGLSHIKFKNEVRGTMVTGHQANIGAQQRLIGTEGQIEFDGKEARIWAKGMSDWQPLTGDEPVNDMNAVGLGVVDLVDALRTSRTPELAAAHAIQATELIFATYESSRTRGRVDLPLTISDSPLMDMLGRA
ncbi:MAG TPA: Gfo/Idh/MocA family oxidoreductase [Tepidisphaeraceae bacterium]|jgi:predicted dehydrogenase|nr:Gfo/Idh/MocA family oxidoreductase [Tepidisphaeraceae bacterium]